MGKRSLATGTMANRQHGFTLLEIMLVMLLLALSATLVVGSLPTEHDRLTVEAQIARQLLWLEEESLIDRQIYGVTVHRDGLRIMTLRHGTKHGLAAAEWPGYVWVPLQQKRGTLKLPKGISLVLEIEGRKLPLTNLSSDADRLPQWLVIPDGVRYDRRLTVIGP